MRNQTLKPAAGKNLSMLIVGESEIILQAMKCWLAPLGHRLTWVTNGLEAIQQLRLQHFDMVFTELAMPGLDGSLIAQYLKNTNDHATVVGLSSNWYRDQSCDLVTDSPAELRYLLDSAAYISNSLLERKDYGTSGQTEISGAEHPMCPAPGGKENN